MKSWAANVYEKKKYNKIKISLFSVVWEEKCNRKKEKKKINLLKKKEKHKK